MKKGKIALLAAGLLMLTSQVHALTVDAAAQPTFRFNDTQTGFNVVDIWADDRPVDWFGIYHLPLENHIFLIDMTENSKDSMRVDENGNMALTNSLLFMNRQSGNVGIRTTNPGSTLDVLGVISAGGNINNPVDDGLTNLLFLHVNNTAANKESDTGFALRNDRENKQWNFRTHQAGLAFVATLAGTGGPEFTIKNGSMDYRAAELYLGNGAKNIGGIWYNASSRALKENIKPLSTEEALAAFSKLQPVTYNYKTDKSEKVVGFIAEDVPELVSLNSRDGLSAMDMVAVLTKVMQEQEKKMTTQEEVLTETKAELKKAQEKILKLEAMQKKIAKIEALLTNLALNTDGVKQEKVSLKLK